MIKDDMLQLDQVFSSKGKAKILEILAINSELNISEIVKRSLLNHSNVVQHLNYLIGINFIQEKKFGRIRIFRYKIENIKARALKKMIEIWRNI
jgi:DNA-binding transcriptional ArsR family regulator